VPVRREQFARTPHLGVRMLGFGYLRSCQPDCSRKLLKARPRYAAPSKDIAITMWRSASSTCCRRRVHLDIAARIVAVVLAPSLWHGVIIVLCHAPSPTTDATPSSSREIRCGRQQLGAVAWGGHCHHEAVATPSRAVTGGLGPPGYHQGTSAPRRAQR
jgi:hypothetical protein